MCSNEKDPPLTKELKEIIRNQVRNCFRLEFFRFRKVLDNYIKQKKTEFDGIENLISRLPMIERDLERLESLGRRFRIVPASDRISTRSSMRSSIRPQKNNCWLCL